MNSGAALPVPNNKTSVIMLKHGITKVNNIQESLDLLIVKLKIIKILKVLAVPLAEAALSIVDMSADAIFAIWAAEGGVLRVLRTHHILYYILTSMTR